MKQKSNTFGDLATLISISGIALYSLGWVYWNFFFKTLNISLSFFDLSFDKVIITTWPFIIISAVGFIPTFIHITGEKHKTWDIVTVIFIILNAVLLSLSYLLMFDYFLWVGLGGFIIYATVQIIIQKKNIEVNHITVTSIRYAIIIAIYMFAIFFYGYSGKNDAQNLVKNYQQDCEVVLKNDNIIIGKFVTHSAGKTFIMYELDDCKKQIIIINDAEILKLTSTLK